MSDLPDDAVVLDALESLAAEAGRAILAVVATGFDVERKADASPVTQADRAAEAIIVAGLERLFPSIPIVAEERFAEGVLPDISAGAFFLVDALDGTREFVAGRPDYTVNIALVADGAPRVGVVFAPAKGVMWSGRPGAASRCADVSAEGARVRHAIRVAPPATPLRIVASRSHRTHETDDFLAGFPSADVISVGSSIKFCQLAEGAADLYPRFGRTMEWDTAAGDAVLRAAGGVTLTTDRRPLVYGKAPGFANPHFISVGGKQALLSPTA